MVLAMNNRKPRYLASPSGRKEAVLLRLGEYKCMLERIEDLEDALALDRAERTSKKLIPYADVRERLKRAGKL